MADYFVQMRKTGKYIPPDDKIIHVQEMLTLMSALTGNQIFTETYIVSKRKENANMRTFLDDAKDEGIAIGKAEGIAEGKLEGKIEGKLEGKITARFEDGMSIEQIAEKTKVSVDLVISVLKEAELIKG